MTRYDQIFRGLSTKEERDAFVDAEVHTGIAFQIRAMREERGMTVEQLARAAELSPRSIKRSENPDNEATSIGTLIKIAHACDVALSVHFTPFSALVKWASELDESVLAVKPFAEQDVVNSREVEGETWIECPGSRQRGRQDGWTDSGTLLGHCPVCFRSIELSYDFAVPIHRKHERVEEGKEEA